MLQEGLDEADRRPANPCFSSGPCAKRPGWSPAALEAALVGRSHRSGVGLARLVEVVDRSRAILGIPADWRVGIVAGSDTGAIEIAMWSLLGARGVDMLAWENFGEGWVADVAQLKLDDVRVMQVPYGQLPDLSEVDPDRDVVFPWNGTTSGVRVPNGDWIAADRRGLTICDATSADLCDAAAVGQARCRDLVMAEIAGRRGGARHAGVVAARRRTARKLHAALAAAQALPADLEGQADRGGVPRRDDQHAVDAVRRGCARIR